MGRNRSRHYLGRAKDEALFACGLYDERRCEPNLEAFVMHMQVAWLNLLTAIFERDHIDYYYRRGRRYEMVDGERKCWDITRCVKQYFKTVSDPVQQNLLFYGTKSSIGSRPKLVEPLISRSLVARNRLSPTSNTYLLPNSD